MQRLGTKYWLRNLKKEYTKAKQHKKGTGNSPMYSPHYDELDEVLGTRAVITMPGVLQAGTPASECSTPGPQLDDRQHVSESEEEDVPLAAVARKRTAANPAAADEATKRKRTRKSRKRVSEEEEGVCWPVFRAAAPHCRVASWMIENSSAWRVPFTAEINANKSFHVWLRVHCNQKRYCCTTDR